MISLLGIALSLALLMGLAYRGISVLMLAPLAALLACLLSPESPLMASYTQVFMQALGEFAMAYLPLFLLGAVFGKLMEASGAARSLALRVAETLGPRHAIAAVVLSCALLTYGGVSLFVVAFAVQPIASAVFQRANLPRELVPATIALGAFTFTMTAMPGTPAIQNAIPMPHFGTTPFAAPGLGVLASLIMLTLGLMWLGHRARQLGPSLPTSAPSSQNGPPHSPALQQAAAVGQNPMPEPADIPMWQALLPIVIVIVANYALVTWFWPARDTSYLATARYGATHLQTVAGLWSVIGALCIAILVTIAVHRHRLPTLKDTLEQGTSASLMPLMSTASLVGYGAVVASLPGFALVRDAVMGIAPGQPLISVSIAVNLLAGITGSASGGMSIALEALGPQWLASAQAIGMSPDLLHRVVTIATGVLDTLPHNGAIVTLLSICGLTHKQAYREIFIVAMLFPMCALVVVIVLGTLFGSF